MFSQYGKLVKVYVQQERKKGRRFRFGFVRFLARSCVNMAIKLLDGVRMGGASLSVVVARFLSGGDSRSVRKEMSSSPCFQVKKQSCYVVKDWHGNEAVLFGPTLSWRNVLMGEVSRAQVGSFS